MAFNSSLDPINPPDVNFQASHLNATFSMLSLLISIFTLLIHVIVTFVILMHKECQFVILIHTCTYELMTHLSIIVCDVNQPY